MERLMEMAKTKLVVCILLASLAVAPAFCQTFTWKRVPMDGHRSADEARLPKIALQQKQLLKTCEPSLSSLKKVVGYSDQALDLYRPQSPLGNLIADITLLQTEKRTGIHCDLSLFNIGGVRQEMPKGEVIMEDMVGMFPFKNTIVVASLSGEKVLELFRQMAVQNWELFSGAKVIVEGDSVVSVTISGKAVDRSATYKLATNSFLYNGGDGLCIKQLSDNKSDIDTGIKIVDMVVEYMEDLSSSGRHVKSSIDDRLTFTGAGPKKAGAHDAKTSDFPQYATVPSPCAKAPSAKKCLTILHTNDTHSTIEPIRFGKYAGMGGVVERSAFIDSVRCADGDSRVLLLDAGDYSQGSPYFTTFQGKVEVEAMNIMGYDVATLGNHEWDNGVDALGPRLRKAEFQTVLCNYQVASKSYREVVKPYTIVRRGGMKIGIIGILANITEVTDRKLVYGLSYINPVEQVNSWAEMLKNRKKCDLVIVLSHCGLASRYKNDIGDVQMVPDLRNVDIVIGGHTHTDLKEPIYIADADGKPVMIVTDYCKGVYVGQIDCYR